MCNFPINFRLPIWSYAKLILTCWLVIPYFNGAAYVYEHFVRPTFVTRETVNIWYVPRKKDVFSKPDDILTAAEKYIQEHGTDEFEQLIHRVCSDHPTLILYIACKLNILVESKLIKLLLGAL